ncbi:MAG: hypothetical protein PSV16_03615 [Flavobacterium sp.]|nr:hypothetical protein [Flavobacterium sp.]
MQILPVEGQYYYFRIVGYLLFALQVFLAVSGFDHLYDLKKINVNKWAMMTVCFIISVHNFFANPWFTVDGILFATVAFYIIARFKNRNYGVYFLAALFCMLSALSKQSFYFIPIIFTAWIAIENGLKKSVYFLSSITIIGFLFFVWINSITTFSTFSGQVSGKTKLSDLFEVGFRIYLHCYHNKFIFASVLLLPFIISFYKQKSIPRLSVYLKWLSVSVFASALIAIPLIDFKTVIIIFFNAAVIAFIYKTNFSFKKIRFYFPAGILLGISWCCALSLGYASPILFSTGIILVFFFLMYEDFAFIQIKKIYPLLAIPVCIFVLFTATKPYREERISSLNYSLATVSPKLKYIQSDKKTFEKYMDLKQLVSRYGNDYIVAPSLPMAHYLFDTQNPMPAEWLTNFEINDDVYGFLKFTSKKHCPVFLEKSFIDGEPFIKTEADREWFSLYGLFIYKNCHPIAETDYFLIYDADEIGKYLN